MKDSQTDTANDIATEKYQGPGSLITGAGYTYASHLISMIAGGLGFGAFGYVADEKVSKVQGAFENFATKHMDNGSFLLRWPAKVAAFIPNMAKKLTESMPGAKRMLENPRVLERTSSVVFATGIGVAAGWVLSTVWGIFKGHQHGNKGKHQFERAQGEIKHLRDENSDLKRINEEIRTKYVEAASSIGRDEQPAAPSTDISAASAPATTLSNVAHLGTVAKAPELAAAH
jgi:hypothetical protein